MSHEEESVRKQVSQAYTRALSGGGCCRPAGPERGAAAALAGYSPEQTSRLPMAPVEESFACGNPVAFSGVAAGEVVLDLGSGAGLDLLLAAEKTGPAGRVIGVDMTDAMIERARRNIEAARAGNVEVRKGIIEALPVEASSVDWVISNCVINLSPEKPKVFSEIARVLKPGGRMLVSDIVAHDLPEWVVASASLHASCVAGALPEADYIGGLRAAGLIDVEVRSRIVYDAGQICSLAGAELGQEIAAEGGVTLENAVQSLAGKVASITVFARKPWQAARGAPPPGWVRRGDRG